MKIRITCGVNSLVNRKPYETGKFHILILELRIFCWIDLNCKKVEEKWRLEKK
jgi:hypothetical protein